MINNEDIAIKISDLMLNFGRELDGSITLVQTNCDKDEFKTYRKAVAVIMGSMLIDIMNPLYEKHPDIKPKELL